MRDLREKYIFLFVLGGTVLDVLAFDVTRHLRNKNKKIALIAQILVPALLPLEEGDKNPGVKSPKTGRESETVHASHVWA